MDPRTGDGPNDPRLAAELERFRARRRTVFYPKTDSPLDDATLRGLRDADPTEGILPDLIAEACRQATGDRIGHVAPLAEQGTFHRLYRASRPNGPALVVRVASDHLDEPDFGLHADAWAMERLRARGLPTLRVHAVDTSREFFPFDYEVLDEAPGRSLRDLDGDHDALAPLLRSLGATVARIHEVRLDGAGWLDPAPMLGASTRPVGGLSPTWREYIGLRLAEHIRYCVDRDAISTSEARRIESAFAALSGLLDGVECRLLHGDLGNHNVFHDGGSVAALIDWEDCLAGDPAFDIAFWATFHPERRHAAFLEGYRSIRPLPADFAPRFWLYYLRIALSKTVHRHRFGYADRPDRPPASHRIVRAMEALENLSDPT